MSKTLEKYRNGVPTKMCCKFANATGMYVKMESVGIITTKHAPYVTIDHEVKIYNWCCPYCKTPLKEM